MKTCSKCGQEADVAWVLCPNCGSKLPDQTVGEVVTGWLSGKDPMIDAVHDVPEVAWQAILQILQQELTDEQTANLAAGPVESLLTWHGRLFIERIESEAATNSRFNHLLGGVWQNDMPPEIWERVQKARREIW